MQVGTAPSYPLSHQIHWYKINLILDVFIYSMYFDIKKGAITLYNKYFSHREKWYFLHLHQKYL